MISPEKIAEMLAEPVAPETLLIYLRGCLSRVDDEGMVNVPAGYITDSIAHVTELSSASSELLTLRAERDEAREQAGVIRKQFDYAAKSNAANFERAEAAEAQLARQGEALKAAVDICEQYEQFIRRVPSANLEEHPYLPALEDVISAARSTLSPEDSEAECPDCGRHVMADPQPATGFIAKCGRRLTRLSECRPTGCPEDSHG